MYFVKKRSRKAQDKALEQKMLLSGKKESVFKVDLVAKVFGFVFKVYGQVDEVFG